VVHETAHNKKEKLKLTQDFNYVLMNLQGHFGIWKIYVTDP
jgi:hypothetical protein